MTTIVERDSSSGVLAVIILLIVLALAVGGFFAYQNGMFNGGPTTVVNKTVNVTAPAKPAAPAPAPAK
jgi:hypothetical protein